MVKGVGKLDEEIQRDLVQYLESINYKATIDAFSREKKKKQSRRKAPLPNKSKLRSGDMVSSLTKYYDDGEGVKLFDTLKSVLTPSVKKKYNSLWFYMQVYFAIYPLLFSDNTSKNASRRAVHVKKSMNAFRKYLETSGVAKNSTFLPYYGLPYVSDPMNHPSFQKLFTSEWVSDLRDRFLNFMLIELKDNMGPKLTKIYKAYKEELKVGSGSTNQSLNVVNARLLLEAKENEKVLLANAASTQSTMQEMFLCTVQLFEQLSLIQQGKSRQANVTDNYLKLIRQRLTTFNTALQQAGQVQAQMKSTNAAQLHEQLSGRRENPRQEHDGRGHVERLISEAQTPFHERKAQQDEMLQQRQRQQQQQQHQHQQQHSLVVYNKQQSQANNPYNIVIAPLDFQKVQAGLQVLNGPQKAKLLQALRWRLNRPRTHHARKQVLLQFVNADVMMLRDLDSQGGDDLLSVLLASQDTSVRETTVRLVNALASHANGREYLLCHDNIVKVLFDALQTEGHSDTHVRQQALGALQKISLRRSPQTAMVQAGIMEWVTQNVLLADDSVSEYSREYGTALLMNLSLRTVGKKRCEKISLNVLAHLCNLLETDNAQVRTYVNGTLYSLLSRSSLVHAAKEMGMEGILTEIRSGAQHTFQRQIDCILQQLRTANPDNDEDEESDDEGAGGDADDDQSDDEDDDDEDEEVEEDELVGLQDTTGLRGEELLCSSYLAEGLQATAQLQAVAEAKQGQYQQRRPQQEPLIPNRPITPADGLRGRASSARRERKLALDVSGQQDVNKSVDDEAFEPHDRILRSPTQARNGVFFPETADGRAKVGQSNAEFTEGLPQDLRDGLADADTKGEEYDFVPPLPLSRDKNNAHTSSQRQIPPPSHKKEEDEEQPTAEYYQAFASRSKVSRTPISSAFAEPNEFK